MKTTLNIDDGLLKEAEHLTHIRGKTALVRAGLEALIAREQGRRLARLGGTEPHLVEQVLPLCKGGITMASRMRTVSIKLPARLDDAVIDLAERRKSSRSALVREALETLTRGHGHSVTAMADELLDTVDAAPDLSTNPRHLKGYGR